MLGSPGIGKSVIGHQIALNWGEMVSKDQPFSKTQPVAGKEQDVSKEFTSLTVSDEPTKEEADLLKQFTLVLHVDLSQIRPNSTVNDVLSAQILAGYRAADIKKIIRYATSNQDKCLWLLDGFDEYNPSFCPEITNIVNGQHFPETTILITSRVRENTVMPKATDAQCMIKGFNRIQAQEFIKKILKLYKSTSSGDELVKFVTDHHLWGVFSVPLMLTYLCLLYLTGSTLKDKVTDLFCSIIKLSLGRHKLKKMKKPAADVKVTMSDYQKELSDLGKLAYLGLENKNTRTVFSQEEAIKIAGEAILDVGLLHKVKSESPLSPSCLFTFGHKSIQECIAAIYISNDQIAFN